MRWRRLALSVVISTLPLALAACADKAQPDPRSATPLVRAVAVQGAASGARSFTGVVAPRVQSDLAFRVAGKVRERLVDAGQAVRRGQPLMRLDADDLQLQAQARQEAVMADRARARQAGDEEARYRDLRGTGAISASHYDQVKTTLDAANAQLKASEAQAEVARNALRYAVLLADADGVVMETLAEPGQVVAAGQVVVRAGPGRPARSGDPAAGNPAPRARFHRPGHAVRQSGPRRAGHAAPAVADGGPADAHFRGALCARRGAVKRAAGRHRYLAPGRCASWRRQRASAAGGAA